MPAVASSISPRHIYRKKLSGIWDEIKACSYQVAFGANDALYRLGCDRYVYVRNPYNEWQRIGDKKATSISASKDTVWIVDWST
jgi:hypothetical protein